MVKASWGTKRTCQNCAARFYDLNKAPIKCPKCGREHDREDFVKVRRGRQTAAATAAAAALAAAAAAKAAAAKKKLDTEGDDLGDTEADDALAADDLEDEDDDIEVEVEVEDDKGNGDS